MAHVQKPDFVFQRNGQVHLNRRGRQFSRLLAGELCATASRVCTARASLCSAVMWRLLVTRSILLFPLHFSLPCVAVCHHISTGLYNPNVKTIVCCLMSRAPYVSDTLCLGHLMSRTPYVPDTLCLGHLMSRTPSS